MGLPLVVVILGHYYCYYSTLNSAPLSHAMSNAREYGVTLLGLLQARTVEKHSILKLGIHASCKATAYHIIAASGLDLEEIFEHAEIIGMLGKSSVFCTAAAGDFLKEFRNNPK